MAYQWDPAKAISNLHKHGIDFADAATVFEDEVALTLNHEHAYEERFITLGMDVLGRLLVVAFTWRGDDIRIISARRATRGERIIYDKG